MLYSTVAYAAGIVIWLVAECVMFIKKVPWKQNILWTLFIIYISLLCGVTFFPIEYDRTSIRFGFSYNFIPFASILNSLKDEMVDIVRNIGGNVLLFFPLGVMLPLLWKKRSLLRVFLVILLCAAGVELTQHIIGLGIGYRYRMVDIDDVILNTLGGMIGYAFYRCTPKKLLAWVQDDPSSSVT